MSPEEQDRNLESAVLRLGTELEECHREREALRLAASISPDAIREMVQKIETYRKLLYDVDQCAPAILDVRALGLDFATALQAVRDELEG
jgi:hypothetical protein